MSQMTREQFDNLVVEDALSSKKKLDQKATLFIFVKPISGETTN